MVAALAALGPPKIEQQAHKLGFECVRGGGALRTLLRALVQPDRGEAEDDKREEADGQQNGKGQPPSLRTLARGISIIGIGVIFSQLF